MPNESGDSFYLKLTKTTCFRKSEESSMRAFTAPSHRKSIQKVYKVNMMPFRGSYPDTKEKPRYKEHQPRTEHKEGAKRRNDSPEEWWNRIYLGTMIDGTIQGKPEMIVNDKCETTHGEQYYVNRVNANDGERNVNKLTHLPFLEGPKSEPVFQTKMQDETTLNIYVDTGAQVDLFPKNMLNSCSPGWKAQITASNTKLIAANDTDIKHEGRVRIKIPLPGEASGQTIELNPFIISSTGNENTMILGYESMKRYGLVPIPGSGLLCTGNGRLPPLDKLYEAIQKYPTRRVRTTREVTNENKEVWIARPIKHTFVPAYQRANITLQPRGVRVEDLNSKNGCRLLVRECSCIMTEECETCIREGRNVQVCDLINGKMTYVVDNTYNGCSRKISPKTDFYINFETVFDMDQVAREALSLLPTREFEVDLPRNPYSEEECAELFQKTKEEVTASLRSIVAEPASWSLDGYQPETLKLIDHQGIPRLPEREMGPPINMEDFSKVNPCQACQDDGDSGCHLERQKCELRKLMRYKELPEQYDSVIKHHNTAFSPHMAKNNDLVVGCLRKINKHEASWDLWFPNGQPKPGITIIGQELCNAVITEVSKGSLLQVSEKGRSIKAKNIHFTNFAAYGVSLNLLQRCIPEKVNIHIYKSEDIQVAGPGYDPRRFQPLPRRLPETVKAPRRLQKEQTIHLEPGLPKQLTAKDSPVKNKPNIITDDPDLRRRCEEMLESHAEVFAKNDTDCGQFWDPETRKPYYFKVRLKSNTPVVQKTRFVAPAKEEAATQLISALIAGGIVKRKYTPYQNQSVYVTKKRRLLTRKEHLERGGRPETYVEGMVDPEAPIKLRHCVDLSQSNVNVKEDNRSTMSPKMVIQRLTGVKSACSLDISNSFLALTLDSESEDLTGFESGVHSIPGPLVYTRCSMGHRSSSSFLETALAKTLSKAHSYYIRFADDIIVMGKDDEEVLERLSSILHLLKIHNWRVKKEKMTIFTKQLHCFGLTVDLDRQVVTAPRASLDAVLMRPRPQSKDEQRSYCGMIAWFGENLGHHFKHTAMMHRMARKDTPFVWDEANLRSYEALQEMFWKPLLHTSLPNYKLDFHLVTDSSEFGSGLVLLQIGNNNDLRVIAYHSHIHDERTARLNPMERESYALIHGIGSFFDIIGGHNTICHTDSRASVLISLLSKSNSKVARWSCLLHSLPWLKISFMSSKAPLLKLADWLSRRPAGAKEWKNKQATDEDLQKVTLAAAKLKRDTILTMRQHELIVDYICSTSENELKGIKDGTVTIGPDGNIYTEGEDEAKHVQPEEQREALPGQHHNSQTYLNHPAFIAKENTKNLESDKPEGELRTVEGKQDVQSSDTESPLVQKEGQPIEKVRMSKVANDEKPVKAGKPGLATTHSDAKGRLSKETGQGSIAKSRRFRRREYPPSSLFQLQPGVIQKNSFNPAILADNVLTFEEADSMGLLSPASQNMGTQNLPEETWDRPPEAPEGDVTGKFLNMTFNKSPWMRLETLIKSQCSDPKLMDLRRKCEKGPHSFGGAKYLIKEGVLIRLHTKHGLETMQVCLSKASAYSLCLRAHVGDGKGTWRSPLGPSMHNGARKLYNMVSTRFYAENMAKMCKDITESCYICAEGKENQAKTRPDAVKNMITPSIPGEAWSIDLLSLPESGNIGGKLLTAQCIFSKFAIAIPVEREATSEYLFHLINWYIFSQQSRPRMILVDNARHLAGSAMRQATNQLNIELRTIPIYSARSNPVENFNGILVKQLRLYHLHHNIPYNQWRETLPFIINAINYTAFEGELGQKYHLSPAKVFYGGSRDSLDPTLRYDMPYLSFRYKDHIDFVEKTAKAAWVTQQIVGEHRQKRQAWRLKQNQIENPQFAKRKDFKIGDVVLLQRNLPPGVISKLRPRSSYRFVVMDTTETVAYCRPFSAGSLQRWADAQKFTKQTKGNIALLPLLILPKERLKLDRTLHLWTSNSRANEHHLFGSLAQPDPEPMEITVDELEGSEWVDKEEVPPHEPAHANDIEGQEIEEEDQTSEGSNLLDEVRNLTLAPLEKRATQKGKEMKKCTFDGTIRFEDGSTEEIKDLPKRCARILRCPQYQDDTMGDLDDQYCGRHVLVPSKEGNGKYKHVPPEAVPARKCYCKLCAKQLSKCRAELCESCVIFPDTDLIAETTAQGKGNIGLPTKQ